MEILKEKALKAKPGLVEFVSLMALLMSLGALSIDAMLPALPVMGLDLGIINENDNQLIVSSLFLGFGIGQLFYGPLSDSFGRKSIIYFGVSLFIIGCIISILSNSFELMILSRIIQGSGVASTRIVTMAMVRDQYSGNNMAQIMSLITMVFILVPALAPALGQLILYIAGWKEIFLSFILLSGVGLIWFWLRQPETLLPSKRTPLSINQIILSIKRTITTRSTIGYTLASAFIFGAFIGYLISSQQIFQGVYELGPKFPIYFGILALAIGCASFINSKLVRVHGMKNMTWFALIVLSIISTIFLIYAYFFQGTPSLLMFMLYMIFSFGCVGILFGNFNSLAIEPLGDIAGVATGVISTIQNVVSLIIATIIGANFNSTIYPLILGFMSMSLLSILIICWTEKKLFFK